MSLIYLKSLELPAEMNDEAAAVTLMSTDVDRVAMSTELAYEIWARLIEIGIGTWLLERQMGAICVAPVLVSIGKF